MLAGSIKAHPAATAKGCSSAPAPHIWLIDAAVAVTATQRGIWSAGKGTAPAHLPGIHIQSEELGELVGISSVVHPGLILGVPPARVAVVHPLPVETSFRRCAPTTVVDSITGRPYFPIGKTTPRHLLAVGTTLVIAHLVPIITFFPCILDTVAATIGHGGGDTACIRIAGVSSTGIAVIGTIQRGTGETDTVGTNVTISASIIVTAIEAVVDEDTAYVWIAGIIGAEVLICALQGAGAWDTGSADAGIFGGTGVAVLAARRVVGVDAATVGTTAIIGTGVRVVAVKGRPAQTAPVQTTIGCGAGIVIVAGEVVIDEGAAIFGGADIGGAEILVITRQWGPRHAPTVAALIANAALIQIVAIVAVRYELATGVGVTAIVGAGVSVAAGKLALPDAIA